MGRKHGKKTKNRESSHTYIGTLDVTRSGVGYVIVENQKKDIFVRPQDFNRSLHGDRVKVKVTKENFRTGRMEGQIIEVIERKRTEYIGHLEVNEDFAFFIPEKGKGMPDIFIPANKLNGAKDGDRVLARLLEWNKKDKNPNGEVVNLLSALNLSDLSMKEILVEAGFPLEFDDEALEESERIPDKIPESEIKKRKDVRPVLTFTIDPADAKDFDDAISFRKLKNGNYEIGVHIADVSHYVETDTALDKDAYLRATSVYLPDRVLPMLPERISNELCSLRPQEDKLTFSAIFQISPKAEVKQHWLGRTVIHSNHRFTYEEVQEIIENKNGIYLEEITILNDIAQKLRKQRFKNGAINFSSQEVRFKLDENGKPVGIVIKESKEAHQLIEELMLLANRTVAERASKEKQGKKELPFPYRVHDTPDEEKLLPFVDFAKKFGHKFDTKTPEGIASSFNKMLQEVQGKPEQHVLEQLGIRTMAKAIYTSENIGHYGLGFVHYCHFTSPIRRYPDIMVHRLLQEILDGKPEVDKKMEKKCQHCSERERAAMEAERAANKYKQVEYMQQYLGEEFEGIISGVASFGFWVETILHKCEGLVSIQNLLDYDDFRLVESEYCLVGRRSGRSFRMGDKVWIKVISGNLSKRQLDYDWVIAPEHLKEEKAKAKAEKKKNK
ncbi:MAG: ribonuclease R [Bacteroidetes bacterium]|nr:MAG: ribonuclease R [Bacteroidota bacterium]